MGKIAYIFILVLAVMSCKTQQKSTNASSLEDETKLVISYYQTSENLSVPEFKIELFSNKQMYLTATRNLDKEGKYMRVLSEKEFSKVLNSFKAANFFKLNDTYPSADVNKTSKYLYFAYNGEEKKIHHQNEVSEELKELEFLMQSFLDRVGWEKLSW